jgi:two-component system LytT family response regulator
MRLEVLIVDDEPPARETLRLLLSTHADVDVIGEAGHGREALALLRARTPDLLFIDVQMPGMSGLDVLRRLGPPASMAVVFVTAYDRYAIEAFERSALDYLLKPFTDERFEQVLSRAKRHLRDRALAGIGARVVEMLAEDEAARPPRRAGPPGSGRRTLVIKEGRRTVLVPVDDIDWIEATDYYVKVHAAGKSHLLRESLRSLEKTLDSGRFVRVHRSAIVNRDRVAALEAHQSGDAVAVLSSGVRVRVSRTFRSSLLSRGSLHRSTTD